VRLLLLIISDWLVSDLIIVSLACVIGDEEKWQDTGFDEAVCIPNMFTLFNFWVIPNKQNNALRKNFNRVSIAI